MQIIGIAGQLGNGKDELGAHLQEKLQEKFGETWHHGAWAEGLKNIYYDAFGVTKEFSEEWKRKPDVPPGFNMTVRSALQQIGDGFRQIKSDVWIDWTLSRAPDRTIITDCRYVNELKRIREEGGINVLVIRPTHINDVDHPSEAHLRPIVDWFGDYEGPNYLGYKGKGKEPPPGAPYISYVIRNDSTIKEFHTKIEGLLVGFAQEHLGLEPKKWSKQDLRRTFVPKGWGYEDWIVNKPQYCGKLLFFKKHRGCSWHYHKQKDETFYVQSGKLLVIYSNQDCSGTGKLLVADTELGEEFPVVHWDWVQPTSMMDLEVNTASFTVLGPGDEFHVAPGLRHAMYALEDTEMFEFSTQHFDEDSFRVFKGD